MPRHPGRLGRRAALACAGGAFAAPVLPTVPAQASAAEALLLRDLYDAAGDAPSAAARRLLGRAVALSGVVQPAPALAEGWYALSETWVAPCALCGLTHDWPVGVVAAEVADLPPLPGPAPRATLTGTLSETGAEAAGLAGRLALRDARVALA